MDALPIVQGRAPASNIFDDALLPPPAYMNATHYYDYTPTHQGSSSAAAVSASPAPSLLPTPPASVPPSVAPRHSTHVQDSQQQYTLPRIAYLDEQNAQSLKQGVRDSVAPYYSQYPPHYQPQQPSPPSSSSSDSQPPPFPLPSTAGSTSHISQTMASHPRQPSRSPSPSPVQSPSKRHAAVPTTTKNSIPIFSPTHPQIPSYMQHHSSSSHHHNSYSSSQYSSYAHQHMLQKRSAYVVAEKTCEMVCYLWFSDSIKPRNAPSSGGSPSSRRRRRRLNSNSPPTTSLTQPLSSSHHGSSSSMHQPHSTSSRPKAMNSLQLTTSPAFVSFLAKLLETTQVSQSVIVLSLHYIYRLKMRNDFTCLGRAGSEFRVAVVALMLANKFVDDNTYTNKTWSDVSGISLQELNKMEREFLIGLDFGLHVDKTTYESWVNLLSGLVAAVVRAKEGRRVERVLGGVGCSYVGGAAGGGGFIGGGHGRGCVGGCCRARNVPLDAIEVPEGRSRMEVDDREEDADAEDDLDDEEDEALYMRGNSNAYGHARSSPLRGRGRSLSPPPPRRQGTYDFTFAVPSTSTTSAPQPQPAQYTDDGMVDDDLDADNTLPPIQTQFSAHISKSRNGSTASLTGLTSTSTSQVQLQPQAPPPSQLHVNTQVQPLPQSHKRTASAASLLSPTAPSHPCLPIQASSSSGSGSQAKKKPALALSLRVDTSDAGLSSSYHAHTPHPQHQQQPQQPSQHNPHFPRSAVPSLGFERLSLDSAAASGSHGHTQARSGVPSPVSPVKQEVDGPEHEARMMPQAQAHYPTHPAKREEVEIDMLRRPYDAPRAAPGGAPVPMWYYTLASQPTPMPEPEQQRQRAQNVSMPEPEESADSYPEEAEEDVSDLPATRAELGRSQDRPSSAYGGYSYERKARLRCASVAPPTDGYAYPHGAYTEGYSYPGQQVQAPTQEQQDQVYVNRITGLNLPPLKNLHLPGAPHGEPESSAASNEVYHAQQHAQSSRQHAPHTVPMPGSVVSIPAPTSTPSTVPIPQTQPPPAHSQPSQSYAQRTGQLDNHRSYSSPALALQRGTQGTGYPTPLSANVPVVGGRTRTSPLAHQWTATDIAVGETMPSPTAYRAPLPAQTAPVAGPSSSSLVEQYPSSTHHLPPRSQHYPSQLVPLHSAHHYANVQPHPHTIHLQQLEMRMSVPVGTRSACTSPMRGSRALPHSLTRVPQYVVSPTSEDGVEDGDDVDMDGTSPDEDGSMDADEEEEEEEESTGSSGVNDETVRVHVEFPQPAHYPQHPQHPAHPQYAEYHRPTHANGSPFANAGPAGAYLALPSLSSMSGSGMHMSVPAPSYGSYAAPHSHYSGRQVPVSMPVPVAQAPVNVNVIVMPAPRDTAQVQQRQHQRPPRPRPHSMYALPPTQHGSIDRFEHIPVRDIERERRSAYEQHEREQRARMHEYERESRQRAQAETIYGSPASNRRTSSSNTATLGQSASTSALNALQYSHQGGYHHAQATAGSVYGGGVPRHHSGYGGHSGAHTARSSPYQIPARIVERHQGHYHHGGHGRALEARS